MYDRYFIGENDLVNIEYHRLQPYLITSNQMIINPDAL